MFSFSKALWAAIICAAFVAPSVALAQVEATPVPLPPKPNLSSLTYFVGTWSCSSKSSRRPSASSYTAVISLDPSGWWVNGKATSPGVAWFPHKSTNYDKYTYDASAKRWVDISYGDYGAYDLSTSSGWKGSKWTWHSLGFVPSDGIKSQSDVTATKLSATRFAMDSSFVENSGRKVTVHDVCTKHA